MGRTGAPDRRARTGEPHTCTGRAAEESTKHPPGGHILIAQNPDAVVLLEQFHDPFTGSPFRDHFIAVDRPHIFNHVIEDRAVERPIDNIRGFEELEEQGARQASNLQLPKWQ